MDSRGVSRGKCTQCPCSQYRSNNGHKCESCYHPPGKHVNLSTHTSHTSGMPQAGLGTTGCNKGSFAQVTSGTLVSDAPDLPMPHSVSHPHSHGECNPDSYRTGEHRYLARAQTGVKQCRVLLCHNRCHYEPGVGEFDYCSPGCRDKDLLDEDRTNLEKHLREHKYKANLSPVRMKQGGDGSTVRGDYHHSASKNLQVHGSSGHAYGQVTIQVIAEKPSESELGLIIGQTEYRQDNITGLLVLGFEYGTVAEHLFNKGDVWPLDVITKINDRNATNAVYVDETMKSSPQFLLNRSLSLPGIKLLMDRASGCTPTHLVTVYDPMYGHTYNTKGYGVGVQGDQLIYSLTENTPARHSHLAYGDEICAIGFFSKGSGKGEPRILTTGIDEQRLKAGAEASEIPVFVIRRKLEHGRSKNVITAI